MNSLDAFGKDVEHKKKAKKSENIKKSVGENTVLNIDEFEKNVPANKNTKDGVFLDLFQQKEYLLQL